MTGVEILLLLIVGAAFLLLAVVPIVFLGVVLLTGKKPDTPIAGYTAVQLQANGLYSSDDVGKVFDVFKETWEEIFGNSSNVVNILNNLQVIWTEDVIELRQPGEFAYGVTDSPTRVRVWIRDYNLVRDKDGNLLFDDEGNLLKIPRDPLLSRTALGHELIHVILWSTVGEPDPDHEGHSFLGWDEKHSEVDKVVLRKLRELNL